MNCQFCQQEITVPILLNCSHKLCLQCAEQIKICESDPLIKAKYKIKCPKCNKITRTFNVKNLIIDLSVQNNSINNSNGDIGQNNARFIQKSASKDVINDQQQIKKVNNNIVNDANISGCDLNYLEAQGNQPSQQHFLQPPKPFKQTNNSNRGSNNFHKSSQQNKHNFSSGNLAQWNQPSFQQEMNTQNQPNNLIPPQQQFRKLDNVNKSPYNNKNINDVGVYQYCALQCTPVSQLSETQQQNLSQAIQERSEVLFNNLRQQPPTINNNQLNESPKDNSDLNISVKQQIIQQRELIFDWDVFDNIQELLTEYQKNQPLKCHQHDDYISLYCQEEKSLLCVSCVFNNPHHQNHTIAPIKAIIHFVKSDNDTFKSIVDEKLSKIDIELDKCHRNKNFLEQTRAQIKDQITKKFTEFVEAIKRKEEQLKEGINSIIQLSLNRYDNLIQEFNCIQENIRQIYAFQQNQNNGSGLTNNNEMTLYSHIYQKKLALSMKNIDVNLNLLSQKDISLVNFGLQDDLNRFLENFGNIKQIQEDFFIRKTVNFNDQSAYKNLSASPLKNSYVKKTLAHYCYSYQKTPNGDNLKKEPNLLNRQYQQQSSKEKFQRIGNNNVPLYYQLNSKIAKRSQSRGNSISSKKTDFMTPEKRNQGIQAQ